MNSSGPWWAIPAFTLGGVLLTLLVTVRLDHRKGRREAAARLTEHTRESVYRWTERKLDLIQPPPQELPRSTGLRRVAWRFIAAVDRQLTDAIARSATEIVFMAPARVSDPAQRTVATARALTDLIEEIHANSKPGHQG